MRVLVTGAAGFVGGALCRRLAERGHTVRAAVRRPGSAPVGTEESVVGEIGPATRWEAALDGVEAVVHLAARVHVMDDRAEDPLALYRQVNTAGTMALASAAAGAGTRRLVFASSIKVNGEETAPGRPFTAETAPRPEDPYGQSKWEAEEGLREIGAGGGLEVCVVRPPLVYGPGVRANFLRLLQAVERGTPLPLGGLRNRRSIVYVENLADVLALCVEHPAAAGGTFLVADEPPLSPADLVRALARALGRPARLLPVPAWLLRAAGRATGREAAIRRLCGSLEVDASHLRQTLGWTPPSGTQEGMEATARWFRLTAAARR